ncbi:hypothetical protein ACTVKS_15375 [Serratia bockelmannii]|uniref:hypothetical protein n=1 Tax=Serratia bockelmannii TaxID=2703793 RepID=UPI003FA70C25
MKEELYDLADHIARSKGALPPVWQDWASEIEMAVRKMANREAQPVGYFVRHRSAWDRPSKWRLWTECSVEDYAEFCKIIATGEADAGRFYEARILYDALPAPAVPDELRNAYKAEGISEMLKEAREYAPLTAGQWEALANNWHQTFVGLSGDENCCRAAMLKGERP